MQHLCAQFKVDVAANIHTVALSGECSVFFISHQVILDVLCRQFHIIQTARIYPSITAISKSCYVKFSLAVFRHDDIREQHRHKAFVCCIFSIISICAVCILQVLSIGTLPVGIIIPVACSTGSFPYKIFRHNLQRQWERTPTTVIHGFSMFCKMYCKCIDITLTRIERECLSVYKCLSVKIELNISLICVRCSCAVFMSLQTYYFTYR